ncbi:hypothetical protein ACLQ3D_27070 [Micromonospora vinacea]|uniref:Antibiotic biosynthesis monooxygenase n=1 Tax=Micromonospora vinacea TaxID=709878 RepID=A0ABS0K9Z0_9ACTN|nr:hypothetical protein [Micromonospora vinacea]MBG6105390.1 hypothetical protein [Micromonospora vinacea]WTA65139.1 hypothetical protein OHB51_21775 [Micromonospora sp. NBC_00855]
MILRLWSGWTEPALADAYDRLLTQDIAPAILARRVDGLRELRVLRRSPQELDPAEGSEFLTAMTFTDFAAVSAFTGGDPSASVVPPAARDLLGRFDRQSRHYVSRAVFRADDGQPPGVG